MAPSRLFSKVYEDLKRFPFLVLEVHIILVRAMQQQRPVSATKSVGINTTEIGLMRQVSGRLQWLSANGIAGLGSWHGAFRRPASTLLGAATLPAQRVWQASLIVVLAPVAA